MSLEIKKVSEQETTTVVLGGRLDTTTAPQLEAFAEKELQNVKNLILDFENLEYISSAGLRIILKLQKMMNKIGTMKLIHVSEAILEIFEVTGFVDFLDIQ